MLIHGKKLIGKNVLSIQEGKIVADIENILLSQKKNKLTGFAVRKKGVLGETGVLAFEDIESFGDDAVVIKKESLIKQTEEAPAALSKTMKNGVNLTALDVVSDSGEDVGEFIDISVDSNTGEIKKVKIQNSDTKNKKSIKAEEISSIDKEQIVLGSETKAKKDKKSEEVEKKDAGSKDEKGVIGKIADEAKAAIIETKEKFESDTENLRSKNTDENKNPDYEVEKIPKGSQIVFPEGGPNVVINTESKIKKPK